jgi:acyl-CoA synthetase (AMP-forming)/AMP-acid ligase II
LYQSASRSVTGELPKGAPEYWAHSVTDLVAGATRDGRLGRIQDDAGKALSSSRVEDAVRRFAAEGLRAGDVVIIEARNTLDVAESFLALWLLGCTVCPTDPQAPANVKAMIAAEAKATATIAVDGQVHGHDREDPPQELIRLRRPKRITGADLALIIFTSGSSGAAKGVLLSHHNVICALRSISAYLGLNTADSILCIPPFFFDYGLYQLLLALFTDCTLILNGSQTNSVTIVKLIERLRPSVLPVVPALASSLARLNELAGTQAKSVRLITNTGGHLSDSAIDSLRATFPSAKIMPMYGLTESKRALYLDTDRYPNRAGSVGRAMPGLDAKVVVESDSGELREAAAFETGELYVRGSSVMQSYHRSDAGAGARLVGGHYRDDNWLATGDLFSTDADGLFYFRGRAKSLIKQGGYCIHPRDIEILAEQHTDIVIAKAIGRFEANGDESVVLFLQTATPVERAERLRIIRELRAAIPTSLMPRVFHFVDQFPATANGKIDAAALAKFDSASAAF